MLVEERAGSVLYRSENNPSFRSYSRLFPARELLVEVLQHLPEAVARLIPWAAALARQARLCAERVAA
jgi:hypothetical protein